MTDVPLILVCDHRGEGVSPHLGGLEAAGYRLVTCSNLRLSLEHLRSGEPGLLVLDPLVPGGEAELAAIERARAGDPPVPLLVVSDPDGPLPRALAAEAGTGAWDVIARDAAPDEWRMRVNRLEKLTSDLEERRELQHRAFHDDRTDLLRPAAFQARLVEHFSAAQRHHFEMALLLLDLDKFGAVNKRYDHTVGDNLIARVGEVIRRALRTEDVAGRLGGDEFAVLLPYTKKVDAAAVAKRLCREIRGLSGPQPGAKADLAVSSSLGFETFDGKDLESVDELRIHAERALRVSKASGGDRGTYYRMLDVEGEGKPEGKTRGEGG